ncbi:RbsD/FucU domain-containing protein [Helicovermis profundi]|uniref:D-ribose pyranase n=1 Tax=Helicovermis profundi TaxID=3065157 RepID=A0AAU9EUB9_9FIRM|nr:D-ribose pyranase [Clostridia bacterium S502]
MINSKIKNSELLYELSKLGESDSFVIVNSEFPCSKDVKVIDLSLTDNVPNLIDVMQVIFTEVESTDITFPEEISGVDKEEYSKMSCLNNLKYLTYRQFKIVAKNAKFIVRTGDIKKYNNLIVIV